MKKIKVTTGRDVLGKFAPKFAEINDDILFGEIWLRYDKLPLKIRSIVTVTVTVLMSISEAPPLVKQRI